MSFNDEADRYSVRRETELISLVIVDARYFKMLLPLFSQKGFLICYDAGGASRVYGVCQNEIEYVRCAKWRTQ